METDRQAKRQTGTDGLARPEEEGERHLKVKAPGGCSTTMRVCRQSDAT